MEIEPTFKAESGNTIHRIAVARLTVIVEPQTSLAEMREVIRCRTVSGEHKETWANVARVLVVAVALAVPEARAASVALVGLVALAVLAVSVALVDLVALAVLAVSAALVDLVALAVLEVSEVPADLVVSVVPAVLVTGEASVALEAWVAPVIAVELVARAVSLIAAALEATAGVLGSVPEVRIVAE